jgi:hypothetical protein
VLHRCSQCQKQAGQGRGQADRTGFGWAPPDCARQGETVKIKVQAWRGTEVAEIAKIVAGRDIAILGDAEGHTAFVEVNDVYNLFDREDRVNGAYVDRYREGERRRERLVQHGLAGGFLRLNNVDRWRELAADSSARSR